MKFILALLLFISMNSYAQYPFEKYPAIKYDTAVFKIIEGKGEYTNVAVARYKNYRVELLESRLKDSCNLLLYFKDRLIKKINGDDFVSTYLDGPLQIADIDGDGKFDFKINIWNVGAAGLASSRESKIYLFNKGDNKFSKTEILDFFPHMERDINKKGKYEIIAQSLAEYKKHNYWIFNLYQYKNGKLINVSRKFGYPIAVPFLFKDTYKVTHRIPKKEMKRLSLEQEKDYLLN